MKGNKDSFRKRCFMNDFYLFSLFNKQIFFKIATKFNIFWPRLCFPVFPIDFLGQIHSKSYAKACQGPKFGANWRF